MYIFASGFADKQNFSLYLYTFWDTSVLSPGYNSLSTTRPHHKQPNSQPQKPKQHQQQHTKAETFAAAYIAFPRETERSRAIVISRCARADFSSGIERCTLRYFRARNAHARSRAEDFCPGVARRAIYVAERKVVFEVYGGMVVYSVVRIVDCIE